MLKINGLNVSIGSTPILRGVELEVPTGSMCGLIGRNGAGKTTLMRAIMGILEPSDGNIRFEDLELTKIQGHKRAHMGIGYMPVGTSSSTPLSIGGVERR